MIVEIQRVSHHYRGKGGVKTVLNEISFSIEPGFNVLLGPNGAGKTTLFNLITGLVPVQHGSIVYNGDTLWQSRQRILTHMGVVFQQSALDLDLTVRQNLEYFAALNGISSNLANNDMLRALSLDSRLDDKVRNLNGGHRRRVELVRCLLNQPTCLLLDEATVGLDIESRRLICEFIRQYVKDNDISVLWSTHLLDEVLTDDYAVLLNRGEIFDHGQVNGLLTSHQCEDIHTLFDHFTQKRVLSL